MDCNKVEPLLDLLDGEDLSPEEEAAVTAHLAECPGCREQLEAVRRTTGLLAGLGPESMAEELPHTGQEGFWADMRDGVLERLSAPVASRRPLGGALWFGSGFAAAACLLLAVWLGMGSPAPPLGPPLPGASEGGGLTVVTGPLNPRETEGSTVEKVMDLTPELTGREWPFNGTPVRWRRVDQGGVNVPVVERKADF